MNITSVVKLQQILKSQDELIKSLQELLNSMISDCNTDESSEYLQTPIQELSKAIIDFQQNQIKILSRFDDSEEYENFDKFMENSLNVNSSY